MDNNKIEVYSLLRYDSLYSTILSSLQQFINISFDKLSHEITNMSQIACELQDFINEQCRLFVKIYSSTYQGELLLEEYEFILEAFESLVTKSLHEKIMMLLGTNVKFDTLVRKYSFLTEEHIGLHSKFDPFEINSQLKKFEGELNDRMTPKDKMIVLKNLNHYYMGQGIDNSEIWKGMLYAVVKTAIPNIKTHLRYCALFRNKTLMTSEEEMIIVNIEKAFEVIEQLSLNNITQVNLSMDKFKELSIDFDKKNLISSIDLMNGIKVSSQSFINDRLLALINSHKKDTWDLLYSKPSQIQSINHEDLNNTLQLNQINITNLIDIYYNLQTKEMKIGDLKRVKSLFECLVKIIITHKQKTLFS